MPGGKPGAEHGRLGSGWTLLKRWCVGEDGFLDVVVLGSSRVSGVLLAMSRTSRRFSYKALRDVRLMASSTPTVRFSLVHRMRDVAARSRKLVELVVMCLLHAAFCVPRCAYRKMTEVNGSVERKRRC